MNKVFSSQPKSLSLLPSRSSPHKRTTWRSPDRPLIATAHEQFLMQITIDADRVTALRRLVISTCGALVMFMRIQPIEHATRMKVLLCLTKPATNLIMDGIMRTLPDAEFGHITPA